MIAPRANEGRNTCATGSNVSSLLVLLLWQLRQVQLLAPSPIALQTSGKRAADFSRQMNCPLPLWYNTGVLRTFQYRLYPTHAQATLLQQTLDECRWLYNHLLEKRKVAWEQGRVSLSYFDQCAFLPDLKDSRVSLKLVNAQVLQNVAGRIDLAFKAFFRRAKAGKKPGYPRFKGWGWYDSFTYPQVSGVCKVEDGSVVLSRVGQVKAKVHRPIQGIPKTCTVKRTSTGKWYVSFACENVPADVVPGSVEAVGIDVGLTSFATLSNGESIENPRFFRKEERALARAQRRLAKEAKGTAQRWRRKKVVARVHERVAHRRRDFAHQHSRRIVNRFQVIAVEDLSVNRMVHNRCLAKSIMDAAWSQFAAYLSYKAESAGRSFVAVNPAYTTQDCSMCGHRQDMPLGQRIFSCPCCGLHLDRDLNASRNILRLGLESLAAA